MSNRRMDVSTGAGGLVTVWRTQFDSHISNCADCRPQFCVVAESLWRNICVQAMVQYRDGKK